MRTQDERQSTIDDLSRDEDNRGTARVCKGGLNLASRIDMQKHVMCAAAIGSMAIAGAVTEAPAQSGRKSQLATLSQMVGDTRIDIVYRRPVARGRDLFGGIVPWDRAWSPSADSGALFTTSTAVDVAGSRLPAGRYSVWMIPQRDSWTIIFSGAQPVFHLPYPAGKDVLRVRVAPRNGDHMETLAFYFPMVDGDSAMLNMHWGKTVVAVPIRSR
ncbi:MAG: DUF2911 domain-containing protein [Gemmatimonadota bacterium]|nr:DUF2911 domain-containing protein [Gemmatimonadota bacterium]